MDLSDYPKEITDFAFDQLEDIDDKDYNEQKIQLEDSQKSKLNNLLYEKINDMKKEIKRGDRSDFSLDEMSKYENYLLNDF